MGKVIFCRVIGDSISVNSKVVTFNCSSSSSIVTAHAICGESNKSLTSSNNYVIGNAMDISASDSYSSFDAMISSGNTPYQARELQLAINQALKVYFANRETFDLIRRRCMEKDFSWAKSAQRYQRMYSEIADETPGDVLPYNEAFQQLADAYRERAAEYNEFKHGFFQQGSDYFRSVEITMTGRARGVLSIIYDGDGAHIYPRSMRDADAFMSASFDNLMDMVKGNVSFDQLYMIGQVKIHGNLTKIMEIRSLLTAQYKLQH